MARKGYASKYFCIDEEICNLDEKHGFKELMKEWAIDDLDNPWLGLPSIELYVQASYYSSPGSMYARNGDPGEPPEESFDIESTRVTIDWWHQEWKFDQKWFTEHFPLTDAFIDAFLEDSDLAEKFDFDNDDDGE